MSDKLIPLDNVAAGMIARNSEHENLMIMGEYHVECYDADGNLKWSDVAKNVVTDQGKKAIMDKLLDLGTAYSAVRIGLSTTTGVAGDTYATRGTLVEGTSYSGNRGTPSFSAASGSGTVTKTTSGAVGFAITGTMTVTGAILVLGTSINTPGDTAATAILFSTGSFSSSRSVISGDTLNVSYTLSM
jgi:hypothetical protein